jgi:hypothetical protein
VVEEAESGAGSGHAATSADSGLIGVAAVRLGLGFRFARVVRHQ